MGEINHMTNQEHVNGKTSKQKTMKQNPKVGLFLLASYKCHNYTILGKKHPSSPMTIQIFFFF